MSRKRLALRESTLDRDKVKLVSPTPEELASLSRWMLEKRARAGERKTYRATWRVGLLGGVTKPLHIQRSYPIDARDSDCVDDVLAQARDYESDRVRRELGLWKDATPDALLSDYILGKAMSDVDACVGEDRSQHQIRPRTASSVKRYLRLFAEEACKGRRIRDVDDAMVMESLLNQFANDHGRASAIHCKSALSKYVFERLKRRGVMHCNPCAGAMDFDDVDKGPGRIEHGMSLGEESRELFVSWVLMQSDHVCDVRSWGKYPAEYRQRVRQVVLDVALAQATCGFRAGELRLMTCDQVSVADDGEVTVTIPTEKSKTHIARSFPLWDDDAAAMFRRRVKGRAPEDPVFPHGTGTGFWDDGDLAVKERRLYDQAAGELDDDRFRHVAGHNWRATLATNLKGAGLSAENVAAILGHDAVTDAKSYTDHRDTAMIARQIRHALGTARAKDTAEVIPFKAAVINGGRRA